MNKITIPLKQRMQGAAVADLQDALQLLLNRGFILANGDGARRELYPLQSETNASSKPMVGAA